MNFGRYKMNYIVNDSFYEKENAIANLGDSIQSLVMDYIYEKIGVPKSDIRYIKRDFASEYNGDEVSLALYTEFVPYSVKRRLTVSDKIKVKGISSAVFYEDFAELNKACPNCYDMLKSLEPIGARDESTCNYLRSSGIQSYLMGCFTVCFPKRDITPKEGKIFFVDTPNELEEYVPEDIKRNREFLSQATQILKYPVDEEENTRLENEAALLLRRYAEEAKLVVTGRLHAAVPCVAMGIPVIFVCRNIDNRFGWVEKFFHPYQSGEYDKIDWNPKVVDIEDLKRHMLSYFKKIIYGESAEDELIWMDSYYRDREKVPTFLQFRKMLAELDGLYGENNSFRYAIWGAGFHCKYAYTLISEMYPNAKLVAITDKYRTGGFHGTQIVNRDELDKIEFDHLVITTVPGKTEAIEWVNIHRPKCKYTLIISQQKS